MNPILCTMVLGLAVIGGFALLGMFTPNESNNKAVDFLWKAINFLGANLGKAKNAVKKLKKK